MLSNHPPSPLRLLHRSSPGLYAVDIYPIIITRSPPIGGAGRNAATLYPERPCYTVLAITCSGNVYARRCVYGRMRLERDNSNTKIDIRVMRRWRAGRLEPHFWSQGAKLSKHSNHPFQNLKAFRNRLKFYREIATRTLPKMNTFMPFAADRK